MGWALQGGCCEGARWVGAWDGCCMRGAWGAEGACMECVHGVGAAGGYVEMGGWRECERWVPRVSATGGCMGFMHGWVLQGVCGVNAWSGCFWGGDTEGCVGC